jgi:hypothetical protein
MGVQQATGSFAVGPGYLDTASIGAPPEATLAAMREALAAWAAGRARPQDYDEHVAAGRSAFARLVGVQARDVCVGSQVSAFAGLVAASLPDGARVVAAEGDFTSVLFPFMAQADRGVTVSMVAPRELAGTIDERTDLAVISAVQSATGEVADLDAIAGAAAEHGARTLVDVSQACGWLPIDAKRFDYVACAAYKWLLCPRGTAFMAIRPERLEAIRPNAAGWYAGEDVWSSIYGGPLRLATSARRLDVSPAWLCWVGTVPPSSSSSASAWRRSRRTTSLSPTGCAKASGCRRAIPPSSASTRLVRTSASPPPASGRAVAPAPPVWRSICTTPRPMPIGRSKRSRRPRERRPARTPARHRLVARARDDKGAGGLARRLALGLRHLIAGGLIGAGTRLPAERALAQALHVSRPTVTAALDELRVVGRRVPRSSRGHPRAARRPAP